jgi:hypothetical protein
VDLAWGKRGTTGWAVADGDGNLLNVADSKGDVAERAQRHRPYGATAPPIHGLTRTPARCTHRWGRDPGLVGQWCFALSQSQQFAVTSNLLDHLMVAG